MYQLYPWNRHKSSIFVLNATASLWAVHPRNLQSLTRKDSTSPLPSLLRLFSSLSRARIGHKSLRKCLVRLREARHCRTRGGDGNAHGCVRSNEGPNPARPVSFFYSSVPLSSCEVPPHSRPSSHAPVRNVPGLPTCTKGTVSGRFGTVALPLPMTDMRDFPL